MKLTAGHVFAALFALLVLTGIVSLTAPEALHFLGMVLVVFVPVCLFLALWMAFTGHRQKISDAQTENGNRQNRLHPDERLLVAQPIVVRATQEECHG